MALPRNPLNGSLDAIYIYIALISTSEIRGERKEVIYIYISKAKMREKEKEKKRKQKEKESKKRKKKRRGRKLSI